MTALADRVPVVDDVVRSRRLRGGVLLLGALALLVLIQGGVIAFYFTPLIIGLAYLGAAAVGGRRGALWAPGIVTTCWGVAVLLAKGGHVSNPGGRAYFVAGFIGVAIAIVLRLVAGVAAGPVGLTVSMGVILLHNQTYVPGWVFKGVVFAGLLAVWGLWELRPAGLAEPVPASRPVRDADLTRV